VHCRQGSRTGALLGLVRAAAVRALRAREDAAGSEDEDVAVGELLFELAGQALLDFMEAREERDGNEDDDGFFAMADFDLEEVGVSGEGSFDCSASKMVACFGNCHYCTAQE
jgi:hypothetical protein